MISYDYICIDNNSCMTIREICVDDLALLQDLAERLYMPAYAKIHTEEQNRFSFTEMYSTESLQRQFAEQKSRFFILSQGGDDRGYAAIYPIEKGVWMLDKLYVDPTCKGMGYGKALMNHICSEIKKAESGVYTMKLHVNRRNDAVAFYRHMGFEIEEEWDIEIADGRWVMDGYTMTQTYNI